MANTCVWFDIPASDLERAGRFYSAVLNVTLDPIPGMDGFVLPHEGNDCAGCIYKKETEHPSLQGILIYMNVQGRLDDAIAKVEANGGLVMQSKQAMGPHGFRAIVRDSEGNRIALHSM